MNYKVEVEAPTTGLTVEELEALANAAGSGIAKAANGAFEVVMDAATLARRKNATLNFKERIINATMALRIDAGEPEAQRWARRARASIKRARKA